MIDFPNEVSGTTAEASWLNRLLRACRAKQIVSGQGYKLRQGPLGTSLEVIPGQGGKSTPGKVKQYKYSAMFANHIDCYPFDGVNITGPLESIAKPYHLRFGMATKDVDGDIVTYSSYDVNHQTRIATDAGGSEIQIIVPFYSAGDIIYVADVDHTFVQIFGFDDIDYKRVDINACGRAWARKWSQSIP